MTPVTDTTPFVPAAASRTAGIVYAVRNIVAEAKKLEARGREVLYLNIGDPVLFDLRPPKPLVAAHQKALRDGSGYTASAGIPESRQAIAEWMTAAGVPTVSDDVVISYGASEAIDLLLTALLEPGDELLVPMPGYPLYEAVCAKLGAKTSPYRLDPRRGWQPDLASLEKAWSPRAKALLLISPGNPTGGVLSEESVRALAEFAAERRLVLLADEVYRELAFDPIPPRAAALAPAGAPVVSFDSLSKSHLVPGWRCGWGSFRNCGAPLRAAVQRLADARLCAPSGAQRTIPTALSDTRHVPAVRRKMKARLRLVERRLASTKKFQIVKGGAAFYSFFRVKKTGPGGDTGWVLRLLEETGVLVVPGSGFGMPPEDGWVRMVTTAPPEVLQDACDRIAKFVG